jgi:hypothetical protein
MLLFYILTAVGTAAVQTTEHATAVRYNDGCCRVAAYHRVGIGIHNSGCRTAACHRIGSGVPPHGYRYGAAHRRMGSEHATLTFYLPSTGGLKICSAGLSGS